MLDPERGQIVRRVNVNAPIIKDPEQVDGFSLGTLPTWVQNALGGAVNENSNYLYARGIITQDIIRFSPEGRPIAERVDRGVWSAEQSYYHEGKNATTGIYEISRVWLDGTLYELAPGGEGSTPPSANDPNWIVVQEKPRNGDDGHTTYLHIKYSNDGGKNFTLPNGETVGDYIGRCTDFNKKAPTSPSDYKWSKNKGEKGDDGRPGADGLTPMPNLLRNADLNPKSVSNDTARNEGFAWRAETANGGIVRHEPNVAAPHAGAKVVSCESFQKSTRYNDVNCIASLYQVLDLTAGVTYTFSVYVKGAGAGWMIAWPIDGTHFKISGANPVDEGQNTAEGWKRYAVTFTARSTGVTNIYLRSWCNGRNGGNGGKVYFACPKLEESYRPTPWTRAQEDFRGAAMRPLGDWDALPDGFQFQSGGVGEEFIDMVSVKSEGALLWWSCKRSHTKMKDTRPNVNAPFWELGQNLKFVATDLLLAKEAVIEGNILASSMSYKVDEGQEQVRGAMILQDGKTHILPKLREGEVREIRVMPLPLYEGQEGLVTRINMSDEDDGYITYHTFVERANGKIRQLTKTRKYRVFNEIKYLVFLGHGKTNYTDWILFELSIREEADRVPEGFEGMPGL